MRNRLPLLLLLGGAGLLVFSLLPAEKPPPPPPVKPAPAPPAPPPDPPRPRPRPCPGPGPCPRFQSSLPARIDAVVGGEVGLDGTELQCPLPGDFHTKNVGGSDGAGLCVFCSMHHAGVWQNDAVFTGLFDWMKHHPGGGYPDKVDRMIEQFCREKNLPMPDYLQVEGTDLEILKAACRSGRMPGVTYSYSPTGRYGGQRIAHMVNLVHADDRHFVILDNNFPGSANYEWLSPAEFQKTYSGGRSGWAVIPLSPGPPLPPHNPKE
jgi:hypothetical protein